MKKKHKWTSEQIEYLSSIYAGRSRQDSTDMFNAKYNTDLSFRAVGEQMRRHGVRNYMEGHKSRLAKGHTPWNKGIPFSPAGSEKGWFKPNQKPFNNRQVGDERFEQGYWWVKVDDNGKWALKHREVWKNHYGVVLEGSESILFKDGDSSNLDIDNLFCVPRHVVRLVSQDDMKQDDPQLNYLIHKAFEVESKARTMQRKLKKGEN